MWIYHCYTVTVDCKEMNNVLLHVHVYNYLMLYIWPKDNHTTRLFLKCMDRIVARNLTLLSCMLNFVHIYTVLLSTCTCKILQHDCTTCTSDSFNCCGSKVKEPSPSLTVLVETVAKEFEELVIRAGCMKSIVAGTYFLKKLCNASPCCRTVEESD